MDNLIGKRLDGLYEVQELIGSGGMANVYKAVMRGHNGPVPAGTVVAVKVLRREFMHDPDLVRRFKNESKAISLLNHPNIVKVYDVSVNDDLQYIVMEYVDGMTLQRVPQRARRQADQPGDGALHLPDFEGAGTCPRQRCGAPGHQAPEHHAAGQWPAASVMDFGIARISRAENQLSGGKAMGSGALYQPGAGQRRRDRLHQAISTRWAS